MPQPKTACAGQVRAFARTFGDNSMANAEKWAASMPVTGFAIDDETAIKVVDGEVEVISEGHW